MRFPLFTWLKSVRINSSGSKIISLLDGSHTYNDWEPKDITYAVFHRIVRDRPMHVMEACDLQNRLHQRYGSRRDFVNRYSCFGMIQADRSVEPGFTKLALNYAVHGSSLRSAVFSRENAIRKLGKRKAKELESNKEMRVLFYLTNELKGVLSETRLR